MPDIQQVLRVQQPEGISKEPTVSSLLINDGLMLSLLLLGEIYTKGG